MKIYKATKTLDSYLPPLDFTDSKDEAEIMVVGGKKIELNEFPKLRGIFKTGVGTDNLPFKEAKKRGIAIQLPSDSTCDIIYEETAAFTCYLILRGLYTNTGNWDLWKKYDRVQLKEKGLLVIGAGRIGSRVIEKMNMFMRVQSFDLSVDTLDSLEVRMRAADCISLHIPLNSSTTHFIDLEKLSWLKKDALVVNTARGAIIDESALFNELSSGRLRAAIDVFWKEPYNGKLVNLPEDRFIRTPHIASTCDEFVKGATEDFLEFVKSIENLNK